MTKRNRFKELLLNKNTIIIICCIVIQISKKEKKFSENRNKNKHFKSSFLPYILLIQVKVLLLFYSKKLLFSLNFNSKFLCNEIRCDIIYIHVNCELYKFSSQLCKKIVEGFFWGFLTNMMKIKGGCWSQ